MDGCVYVFLTLPLGRGGALFFDVGEFRTKRVDEKVSGLQ